VAPKPVTVYFLAFLFIGCSIIISSCNKNSSPPDDMYTWTITAENFHATGGTSANRCYINLYDGRSYTSNDTTGISRDKIDLTYSYIISSGNYFRLFSSFFYSSSSGEPIGLILNAEDRFRVSSTEFDALQSSEDIQNLVNSKVTFTGVEIMAYVSYINDNSVGNIFAFTTRKGKLGFLKIGPYTQQVPSSDKAPLTLTVKIQK